MEMFLHSSVLSLLGFSLAVLPVCTASAIPENFSYSSAVKQNYEYCDPPAYSRQHPL